MTSAELAEKFKMTRRTVQRWIKAGAPVDDPAAMPLCIEKHQAHLGRSRFTSGEPSAERSRPAALLFAERWDETHFLELGEQAEQRFLRVRPLQETVPARFSGIGHDVVLKVEDGFAERPGDRGFKGIIEETVPLDESLPDRAFVGHKLCEG